MERRPQHANQKGTCERMMERLSILAVLENYSVNTTSIEACGLCVSAAGSAQVHEGGWPARDFPWLCITVISLYHFGSFPKACLSCQATHRSNIITQNKASGFRGHCIMIGREQDYHQIIPFFFFDSLCF